MRRSVMKPLLFLMLLMLMIEASAAEPRSIWDGVYSNEQASRGKNAYLAKCADCHGKSLVGIDDAAPLIDEDFLKKWNGKSVGRLIDVTRRTMPTESPGTLRSA